MSLLFDRKWKLTIITFRGTVIEVHEGLRVTFRVEKNINRTLQLAEVSIYNLSAETETDIFKNAAIVILEAGYQNDLYGQIFRGEVRQTIRGKESPTDYFLKLICIAGDEVMNISFCSAVLSGSLKAKQIAEQIASSSRPAFDIQIRGELSEQQLQAPKVIYGKAYDVLRSLAINNNANLYVDDNGSTVISTLSQHPPASVPELNAQSGLIGFPHQTDQGISFRSLINPRIALDSWVKLNNSSIIQAQIDLGVPQTLLDLDGLYRVINIVITGDTRGNEWYYDIDAVNQDGGLASIVTDRGQNGL